MPPPQAPRTTTTLESSSGSYDYLSKVVICGSVRTGKTKLIERYVGNTYSDAYMNTIGVDFNMKRVQVNDKVMKLQIWDTAGDPRFRVVTAAYYRGAAAILFLYSVDDLESFTNVKDFWVPQVEGLQTAGVMKVLMANKCDIVADDQRRVVSTEQGQTMATELGMEFMEVSAKESFGIDASFSYIATQCVIDIEAKAAAAQAATAASSDHPATVFMSTDGSNTSE